MINYLRFMTPRPFKSIVIVATQRCCYLKQKPRLCNIFQPSPSLHLPFVSGSVWQILPCVCTLFGSSLPLFASSSALSLLEGSKVWASFKSINKHKTKKNPAYERQCVRIEVRIQNMRLPPPSACRKGTLQRGLAYFRQLSAYTDTSATHSIEQRSAYIQMVDYRIHRPPQ